MDLPVKYSFALTPLCYCSVCGKFEYYFNDDEGHEGEKIYVLPNRCRYCCNRYCYDPDFDTCFLGHECDCSSDTDTSC